MSQEDVLEFLKKHPDKWFYSKEISHLANLSIGSVCTSLKRLRKSDEILFKGIGWKGDEYQYKFKG